MGSNLTIDVHPTPRDGRGQDETGKNESGRLHG